MIKLGELFCGPGGFAEGAKKAKYEPRGEGNTQTAAKH